MQMIKNSKCQICDFRSYIDVDIKKEMEDITKIIEVVHQKLIENTGIPMNRLQIDLANTEGDIGTETVWSYLDDNTDPAGDASGENYERTVWTNEEYDDSVWKTGKGSFGSKRGNEVYNGNETFKNLTRAINAGIGESFDVSKCRFDKIIITSDGDEC